MESYPLEKQVTPLDLSKKLAGLLGDDAPESLWVWVEYELRGVKKIQPILKIVLMGFVQLPGNKIIGICPAYSGDELGVLLKNAAKWKDYPCYYSAEEKAALAIQGLKEGWIKPKDFKYGI